MQSIGKATVNKFSTVRSVMRFAGFSLWSVPFGITFKKKVVRNVLLKQVYFTGLEALPIISWIAIILGLVIVTQALSIMSKFGGGLIGDVLVWVIVREAGPVFAAVIVIARSGTAIASELGSMKINAEVRSLELMGIDPMRYLIAPRVIGTMLSVFALTFFFEAVAILGGYLLAGFGANVTFSAYTSNILEAMSYQDVLVSVLKSVIFGLIIGAECSFHGLAVGRSITQIPQKTTRAVMGSLLSVFIVDAFLTLTFYV